MGCGGSVQQTYAVQQAPAPAPKPVPSTVNFNVCISPGQTTEFPDFVMRVTAPSSTSVGQVIRAIQEVITAGLEDDQFTYSYDDRVVEMVPYFSDSWDALNQQKSLADVWRMRDSNDASGDVWLIGTCSSWLFGDQIAYWQEKNFDTTEWLELKVDLVNPGVRSVAPQPVAPQPVIVPVVTRVVIDPQARLNFNVCVSPGSTDDFPDFVMRVTAAAGTTVGQVIGAIQEVITAGLEDDQYSYSYSDTVTGMIPYFSDSWDALDHNRTLADVWHMRESDDDSGDIWLIGTCDSWGYDAQAEYWQEKDFDTTEWKELTVQLV